MHSIFIPLVAALSALVEYCSRFVRRPNLDCFEVRLRVVAFNWVDVRALNRRFVNVLPGLRSAQHVIDFLALEWHLVLYLVLDNEYVRAALAKEPEVGPRLLDQQHVGARRTEEHVVYL